MTDIVCNIGNTTALLESALGDIREIHGGLKVTRSNPLVSLMFLKNIERIYANDKENKWVSNLFYLIMFHFISPIYIGGWQPFWNIISQNCITLAQQCNINIMLWLLQCRKVIVACTYNLFYSCAIFTVLQ